MPYLTSTDDIKAAIAHYSRARLLWLDTEVADYQTKKPRLSLIQILSDLTDLNGTSVIILDVLDKTELVSEFIEQIMLNPNIEKVLHNAKYDRQFLGKRKGQNITCTLEMVQKIPYYLVPLPNYKLKTLAENLCNFPPIDKTEQGGDWGKRPLTEQQLNYAKMDMVYLAQVHHRLLQLNQVVEPKPETENIMALTMRYRQILHRWKELDTEIEHLKNRLKKAMSVQNTHEFNGFKLAHQTRKHKQVLLSDLAQVIQASGKRFDLPINLTQNLQKDLADVLDQLPVIEEQETILMLKVSEVDEDDLMF